MTQLFRVSAFQAKNKLSFHAYEELIMLLFAAGVDVGDVDHSRMTAREMNEVVAGITLLQIYLRLLRHSKMNLIKLAFPPRKQRS